MTAPDRYPELYLAGVPKAGTTTLWDHLTAHPGIYAAASKEPSYFIFDDRPPVFRGPHDRFLFEGRPWQRERYLDLYRDAGDDQRCLDASVGYVVDGEALVRIDERVPGARIIVLLRHPVARAFSQWQMGRALGVEPLDFAEALAVEPERRAAGWSRFFHYADVSRYADRVAFARDRFGDRLLVVRFDDLAADPETTVRSVFAFAGVDPDAAVDATTRSNPGLAVPRANAVDRLTRSGHPARRVARALVPRRFRRGIDRRVRGANLVEARLDPGVGEHLAASFVDDVTELEAGTGWDLSTWKVWAPRP